MTVTTHDLIEAIEGSFFVMPAVPGLVTHLALPGIEGHYVPASHPEVNIVGHTRLTEETVETTIAQVQDVFQRENKIVGWVVFPNDTPPNLAGYLTRAGFTHHAAGAGMALTDLGHPIRVNPAIRVERATVEEVERAVPMVARAYDMPEEAARLLSALMRALSTAVELSVYLAYLQETNEPVAFANSLYMPGTPIVVLQGAGTLPEQRGQGIYSTLVARRLQDARERGVEAAVIQANRATSAPIAEKLGFQELCALEIYAWDPASKA